MQTETPKPKYFTWELLFALAFYFSCFVHSYSNLLWGSQYILGKDAAAWYGPFHYFIESLVTGHIPYWNPYAHGGEPFYFIAQHFKLFDPLMILPLLWAKLFQPDLLKVYNVFLVLKEFIYCVGVLFLTRYFFRSRYSFFFLAFLFLCLYQNEAQLLNKTNTLLWFPWLCLSAIHFYQTQYKPALYLAAYLLGIIIGAGNVSGLFLIAPMFGFLFALCVTDLKKLTRLVKTFYLDFSLAAILSLSLSLPFIVTQVEKNEVYPVGESYGAREYSIEQFQSQVFHPPLSYESNFLNPSYFSGNYVNPKLLKYYLSHKPDGLMTMAICLMLCGLVVGKFIYKRHLVLCLIWVLHLSIATTPTYRFLFSYFPLFNQLKHPVSFLMTTEIILLFFIGYGLLYFIEHKNRFFVWTARGLLLLALICWGPGMLQKTLGKWNSELVDRAQTVNQLNPIYEELSRNQFRVGKLNFASERLFSVPRPGVLLYEPLLLKKNLALTTIIEPSKGNSYGGSKYMRLSQDPVISNRTIYWPRVYVPLYLLGEKNIGAFLDLMGVGQPLIRFYTENQTLSYPHFLLSQLFLNFDYQYDQSLQLKYALTQDKLFLENEIAKRGDDVGFPPKISPQLKHFNANGLGFSVSAPSDGYLLYNDSFSPYWSAFVDGKPTKILLANLAFKAIEMSKGSHFIHFNYYPIYFAGSLYITFFVQLFCFVKLMEWLFHVLISRTQIKRWAVRFQ